LTFHVTEVQSAAWGGGLLGRADMTGAVDDTTAGLAAWIGGVLPGAAVCVQSLGGTPRGAGVDLRLLRAAPRPLARTADAPLVADLDYLATVQLADAAAEQTAVVELLFAAMQRQDLEVLAGEDVVGLCAALGVAPAPGFVLRTPLVRERAAKERPLVRRPMVILTSDLGVISGQVLGPADTPVAGASVQAVGLDRFARTDRDGRFQIGAAPGAAPVRLVARARGVEIESAATAGEAVILRLPLEA
jgi:hypothetical protein